MKTFEPIVTIDGSEKIVASRINSLISEVKEKLRSQQSKRRNLAPLVEEYPVSTWAFVEKPL